jgi:D-glycero-alpha-D-manno-heptose-7-phosphate kinase
MIIEARAPTRVDLAGGTLDIYPLYLLEEDVWTINAAVEIPVRVRLSPVRRGFVITSRGMGDRIEAESLDALPLGGPMDLVCRALRLTAPRPGLAVTLASSAPPGSGLGASSALLVALLTALDRLMRRKRSRGEMLQIASLIEVQSLRMLTGRQDHLPAACGGVNAIRFGLDGDHVERLLNTPLRRRALEDRLVIAYTGRPHSSGLTNWGVLRAYFDGIPNTVHRLRSIAHVARQTRDALRACDLEALGKLVAEEWAHRRELAAGVSTPLIERALSVARRAGAEGGKACGAGGGGCVVLVVRAGAKRRCEGALRAAGFQVLPARIAAAGVQIRTMPE